MQYRPVPMSAGTILDARRDALQDLQRRQVIHGLATSIVGKGYAATTIADIARAARISKSTVYDHFADKESVFLALHREIVAAGLAVVQQAYADSAGVAAWEERVRRVVAAYLAAMTADPVYFRVALVEVAAVSEAARLARREAFDRYAGAMVAITTEAAAAVPGISPLTPALALGALGGINELILRAADDGPEAVLALEGAATDLLVRLMRDPATTTTTP
jgi:AcrR family transcriptional regulator